MKQIAPPTISTDDLSLGPRPGIVKNHVSPVNSRALPCSLLGARKRARHRRAAAVCSRGNWSLLFGFVLPRPSRGNWVVPLTILINCSYNVSERTPTANLCRARAPALLSLTLRMAREAINRDTLESSADRWIFFLAEVSREGSENVVM